MIRYRRTKFRRSNRSRPCPICKGDGCGQADGLVLCWRVESDERARSDAWIHRFEQPTGKGRLFTVYPPPLIAPIDRRHLVYNGLLQSLTLKSIHAGHLRTDRRLSNETIAEEGFASVPGRKQAAAIVPGLAALHDLTHVPGFYRLPGQPWAMRFAGIEGFFIPLRDVRGRIAGLQIRRWPENDDKKRYLLLSTDPQDEDEQGASCFPHGARSDAPMHFAKPHKCADGVIITEGALKANVAAELCDLCVVGLVAAGTFSPRVGWELRDALPRLRRVRIAYDADKRTNETVARQLKRLKRALEEAGIDQSEWTWQAKLGNGLDDYLINSTLL